MKKLKLFSLALMAMFTTSLWADETTTFDFTGGSTTGLSIVKSGTTANISYEVTNSTYHEIPTLSDGNYFLGMNFTSNSAGILDVTTTDSYSSIKSISFDCAADNNSNPKVAIYIIDDQQKETEVQAAMVLSSGSTKVWRSKKSGSTIYTLDLSSSPKTGKVHFKFTTGSSGKSGAIDDIVITTSAETFDATFDNGGHGTAPSKAEGVSFVTLTEITGVEGWQNTSWVADKATKVGSTDKEAGATLNIGDKVTLLENTTFTAQWEEDACPSGMTISGEQEYEERTDIELTASLAAGNGEITYQWYKGSIAEENALKGKTSATLTIENCAQSDAGNYYCVASKDGCEDAESAACAVTVSEYVCPTSGVLFSMTITATSDQRPPRATDADHPGWLDLSDKATITGDGTAKAGNKSTSGDKGGIKGGNKAVNIDGNDAILWVALECPLQAGDTIKATIPGGGSVYLTSTCARETSERSIANGTDKTYVVKADDGLDQAYDIYVWKGSDNTLLSKLSVIRPEGSATAINEVGESVSAVKRLENGMLVIEKNGKRYNAQGQIVR